LKSQCPCGAVYTIKPEFLGQKTVCKKCGQSFLIAALTSPGTSEYLEPPPEGPEVPLGGPSEPEPALRPVEAVLEEAEEIRPVPEEVEPVKEPIPGPVQSPPGPIAHPEPQVTAVGVGFQGGRRPFLALTLAAVAGILVGAGLMGLVRQGEIDGLEDRLAAISRELQSRGQVQKKVETLKKELALIQDEIRLLEEVNYPAGSIPQTLTEAAVLEYKTAEALLKQQAAALESGAGLTVTARGTRPDPRLATAVEGEMTKIQGRLGALRLEAEGLTGESWSLIQTAIATEELNLAILNRNRLIARYGLSAPLPPRGSAEAGDGQPAADRRPPL
jgi:hypothetical protein